MAKAALDYLRFFSDHNSPLDDDAAEAVPFTAIQWEMDEYDETLAGCPIPERGET